ncbi:MAG: D-glycero-beta-D-manno-heptose 1-phosphate adenylyltransferase [Candidatus Cloacimonadota bacterium]|nr:D-glycero-beta-D-manno-heptose 1-phosphate adenylyltransferase [Candidatus Cloacimonadota bacterium]
MPITDKIIEESQIARKSEELHAQGKRIVFTNGCFDILHAGHVCYLAEAKSLADILIVGLNSDLSVKRLKGSTRPINCERDRALVLAGLSSVDYICIFGEDTPYELIKKVRPEVLVKGGDWPISEIVGADIVLANGGRVKSLSYVAGLSTTELIAKLRKNNE